MSQNFKVVSETMYIGIGNVNTMPIDINVKFNFMDVRRLTICYSNIDNSLYHR